MGTCTGTSFRGRSAHQDVDLPRCEPRGGRCRPRARGRIPGAAGGRGASGRPRPRHEAALSPGRAAGPGPVGAVRDGLGVAPPRPGAPTRTAAEATVSNDTLTLSCGFLSLPLEYSFP